MTFLQGALGRCVETPAVGESARPLPGLGNKSKRMGGEGGCTEAGVQGCGSGTGKQEQAASASTPGLRNFHSLHSYRPRANCIPSRKAQGSEDQKCRQDGSWRHRSGGASIHKEATVTGLGATS